MNILYLTQFFSSTRGGGEVVLSDYASGMAQRGHQVHVICHMTEGGESISPDGLRVHRIKPVIHNVGGLPTSFSQNLAYIINAVRKGNDVITKNNIDIIHTNNFSPVIAGLVLSKIRKIPVLTTVHDIFSTSLPDFWKKWSLQDNISLVSSYIGPFFEKLIVLLPNDLIHTVSNATKEDLVALHSKPGIIVIPNGIDLFEYDYNSKVEYNDFVLFIGRMVFYKNVDVIIESFKYVCQKLPNCKLVLVGDGPMRKVWEEKVTEGGLNLNVEFTGYISREEKTNLLRKCSILVLPSSAEGFGMVILEAFAMKKPVLVPNIKPYDEIVIDGVDGFRLPLDKPGIWAEKIVSLLSDKKKCEIMGSQGWQKTRNKFNLSKTIELMELTYSHLIQNSAKART